MINTSSKSYKELLTDNYHQADPYTEWRNETDQSNLHLHSNLNQDKLQARINLVTNKATSKNPLAFTDPTDRMAATAAKAQRIFNADWYKKLPDRWKNITKKAYYEAYVVPAYKDSKLPIPDKDTWINNIDRPRNPFVYAASDPASYYEADGWRHYDHFAYGFLGLTGKTFDGMTNTAIWSAKEHALISLKLANFFGIYPSVEGKELTPDDFKNIANFQKKQASNISNSIFGNIDFWNQTHPSQSIGDKIGSLTGEIIATLPLYEALDAGLASQGEKALEILGSGKLGTKAANFSKFLELSDKGQFLARRLSNVANGYLSSVLVGGDQKSGIAGAMAFLGLASFGEIGSGLWRVGSNALAKKFSAEILAQGGRPFQQAVTDEATHQLDNLIIGHDNLGNEIRIESKENGAGIIHWGNKKQIPYNNPTELQQRITPIIQDVRSHDPVKFDLMSAEKGVLNSLSLTHFGKTYGKLDAAEKTVIRIARANQVKETINEFPVHAPEIAKAHIESNLAEERKENPYLDSKINYLEQKYGQKFSSEIQDAEAEKIKLETGIKSPEKATAKVGRIQKQVEVNDAKELSRAAEEEPRRYVQFKNTSLAYFKNPFFESGEKHYSSSQDVNLQKWLDGMSDEDFDKEVKDHIGNNWFFESPEHLMLWAFQYKNQMPAPFRERIIERLADLDPTGTPTKWFRASKNMERHLDKLADTGKLFTEGNVFRSSSFDTWGNRTKWQKQLNNQDLEKAEKLQLVKVLQPLKQNFPEDVQNASTSLKNLQMLRRKATSAGEDLKITSKIKSLISSASKGF